MSILERMSLEGKSILITGGARGIGKSVAEAFAEAKGNVAIADLNLEEAQKTATELSERFRVEALAIRADVTNQNDVEAMVASVVEKFGKLDVAFCNAGIVINEPAETTTLEQWQKVIDVNLTGVFLTNQAAGKVMIAQGGGSIINTASMSGTIVNYPQPQASYNASKAAVVHLSKSLAVEWADKNVRVNSISPGYIGTDLTLGSEKLAPLIKQWEESTPMSRLGRPEELQGICLYLASEASTFTTGSDFIIDGGFTTR